MLDQYFSIYSILLVVLIAALSNYSFKNEGKPTRVAIGCVFLLYMVFIVGLRNPMLGADTEMYLFIFDAKSTESFSFNPEWLFYFPVSVLGPYLGQNGGLIIVALMFSFGLLHALKLWGAKQWPTLLLFIISGWSFYSAAINVIRAGVAISFTLCAAHYALKAGKWTRSRFFYLALWSTAACCIHTFQFIFLVALLGAILLPCIWVWLIVYFSTAVAVFSGINPLGVLGGWIDISGFLNERAEGYILATADYKIGFRWDFFGFSTLMLIFPFYYIVVRGYKSLLYVKLVCYYLICATAFVAAFYISYSDRVGLISFFLVPFLAVVPIADREYKYAREDHVKVFIAGVFYAVATFYYIT